MVTENGLSMKMGYAVGSSSGKRMSVRITCNLHVTAIIILF